MMTFDVVMTVVTSVLSYRSPRSPWPSASAKATNMGGGAFGVLCAFLVPPATLAATMAGSAIAAAEGMLTRSAREVRGVATDMADFEDDVVRAVQSIEKALG